MIIIIVSVLILLVLIHHYYLHYGKKGRLLNLIPGPPPLPVLGNSLFLNVPHEKLWQLLCKVFDQYYPIFRIWFFHISWVGIRHPDDIQAILGSTKHIEKSCIYTIFHPWLQTGLFTSGGSKWRTRRQILTSTFHRDILKQFGEIFIKESNCMVTILKDARRPVVKELLPFVSEHTLNIICESTMGVSLKNSIESQQYRKAIHQICEIIVYRFQRIWLYKEWILKLLPLSRKQRKTVNTLHSFTEKIIKERRQYHQRSGNRYLRNIDIENIENGTSAEVDDTEIFGIKKRRLAMLDLLIAMSKENNLTDSDIREEVDIFTFAGHDTTAITLMFALMLLAEHKDIQDRVRLEINTIFKENSDKFTVSSLQNLPYLDRCIKEVLRLYPSVPAIARMITEDVKLQSYTIPAGTNVAIFIYSVHRDPNFWPNPEEFHPDRFLERSKNCHPYSYLPFSAGSRNCIGHRFALLELKTIIASLIHNFYLEPVTYLKDVKLQYNLMLCPTHPVYVKFVPIESL